MDAVLRAIRGATTLEEDTREQIDLRTKELVQEMLSRNEVVPEDIVSIIFTATDDVTAGFPATAARALGLDEVPLLGARELAVAGALGLCIRVLMHCYTKRAREDIRHVYLEGARELRRDLAE